MTDATIHEARILLVDDQPSNLRLLERILEQGGYRVFRSLTDSRQALPVFTKFHPDLVLLDLMMPDPDGFAVLEQLRPHLADGDFLPILVLTADITPETRRRALSAGAKDFLTKPVDTTEVLLRMKNLLETRFLYRQLREHNQSLETAVRERTSALREQTELMDRANEAIVVQNLEGQVVYWNKGAERLYGWSRKETANQAADALLSSRPEVLLEQARDALRERGEWRGELTRARKDGREIFVLSQRSVVSDDLGRPRAQFMIDADVTEVRRLESQLQRAQRLESVGTLAAGIAHDLNNMMTPLVLGIELLQSRVTDRMSASMLATMQAGAQRGTELVKQILTFVRGCGQGRRDIALAPLVKEVGRLLAKTFPSGIDVQLSVGDSPAVHADPTQLHQVLMNLCVNARDAMPTGGRLTLSLESAVLDPDAAALLELSPGRYTVLAVEDTGTGIPPAIRGEIFEPFFTTKELGKGTGLGLPTVRNIVQGHGGAVEVRSMVGRGSCFRVYLPTLAHSVAAEAPHTRPATDDLPLGRGERVLVVDDEASIREITRTTLEASNYQVLTAQDGTEAVMLCLQYAGAVQAVLTDMAMPILDGPATIRALLALDPTLRIIGLSGGPAADRRREEAPEVRAFLTKPYSAATLLTTLRRVLDGP